jgi:electron transport complex protein RnfG
MAARSKPWYQGVLLGGFSLIAAVSLGLAYKATAPDIAERLKEDLNASLEQVIPAAYRDNDLSTDTVTVATKTDGNLTIYRARKDHAITALAYRMTGQGYGGSIILVMGVDTTGKILGVRVVQHAETPGLGDKIEILKDKWITGFDGLSTDNTPNTNWAVKKDGGQFDQFSGATITPRAVVKAVRHGLDVFATYRKDMLADKTAVTPATSEDSSAKEGAK